MRVNITKKIIGHGLTPEIFGKQYNYTITEDGMWHLNPCTVIGNNEQGLLGLYKARHIESERRRLNPYVKDYIEFEGITIPVDVYWPDGIMPYEFDPSYSWTQNDRNLWDRAIKEYASKTSIQIVPYTNQDHYVKIQKKADGCWAGLGYMTWAKNQLGYQVINLDPTKACGSDYTTFVHEIGHTLGMEHTHQRSDRDNYITVNEQNIQGGQFAIDAFKKSDNPICGCYDCGSMMHYSEYSFSNDNKKTIESKDPSTCIIERNKDSPITPNDALCINAMYSGGSAECGAPTPPVTPTPKGNSSTGETDESKSNVGLVLGIILPFIIIFIGIFAVFGYFYWNKNEDDTWRDVLSDMMSTFKSYCNKDTFTCKCCKNGNNNDDESASIESSEYRESSVYA